MNRERFKRILVLSIDMGIVFLSYMWSHYMRFDFSFVNTTSFLEIKEYSFMIVFIVYLLCYIVFKLSRTVWAKVSIDEAVRIVLANLLAFLIIVMLRISNILKGMPLSVIMVMTMTNILAQFSYRILYRYLRIISLKTKRRVNGKRILIYGAGSAGQLIAAEILENTQYDYNIIGYIDDNPNIKGASIYGIPIFGDRSLLNMVITQYAIDEIFVAMPSVPLSVRKEIIQNLVELDIPTKTVGSSRNLIQGNRIHNSLRKITISDLLDRQEIIINDDEIASVVTNRTILVTGAGGSIGSELIRQIIRYQPKCLILVDINETGLYEIEQELNMLVRDRTLLEKNYKTKILSIRDYESLDQLFAEYRPEIVFHAAAHKHVPLMEAAPEEAIKNNILGTKNLIDVAIKYNVDKFINISTDKAVNPTNVMGATKRFNEMMLQCYNQNSNTRFVAVRFGNVLGSNGSVVPLFQKQIEQGGPVTVTHKDIIRFFMTIPEAVSLVLQAASYAEGGEIFVLDMGEPVKILHLAEKVIELSGYRPYDDIEIMFTGLRPGEKLYEEILMAEEGLQKTSNELIYIANPMHYTPDKIQEALDDLNRALKHSSSAAVAALQRAVPTFKREVTEKH